MFYAIDVATGEIRWSYDIRKDGKQISFHGDPLVAGPNILVGTDFGCEPDAVSHVYAFDQSNGRVVWKHRGKGFPTNLVRIGERACFGTIQRDWGCLSVASGDLQWSAAPAGPPAQCDMPKWVASERGLLFGIGHDQVLYALDTAKRRVKWKAKLPASPSTAPAVAHGSLYVGATDGSLHRLNLRSGRIERSIRLPAPPAGRIATATDTLYVVLDDPLRKKGFVAALDPSLKRILWVHEGERPYASDEPHVSADRVYVGTCRGALVGLSRDTGSVVYSAAVSGCIRSIGEGADGLLLIGVQEGTVYAIRR